MCRVIAGRVCCGSWFRRWGAVPSFPPIHPDPVIRQVIRQIEEAFPVAVEAETGDAIVDQFREPDRTRSRDFKLLSIRLPRFRVVDFSSSSRINSRPRYAGWPDGSEAARCSNVPANSTAGAAASRSDDLLRM